MDDRHFEDCGVLAVLCLGSLLLVLLVVLFVL